MLKKKLRAIISFVLCVLLFASFVGCEKEKTTKTSKKESVKTSTVPTKTEEKEETEFSVKNFTFETQYISTNGGYDKEYPIVKIIRSEKELEEYYDTNKETYQFDMAFNSETAFYVADNKYDEKYFENQILILVLVEEGSGSIRHAVTELKTVTLNGESKTQITINRLIPTACTADMALWHIFIEPEAGVEIESEEDIEIIFTKTVYTGRIEWVDYSSTNND